VAILDEQDRPLAKRRVKNNMEEILGILAPLSEDLKGIVVESTYNWYWLVDGLVEAGYVVHLANTCAIKVYEGKKHMDDKDDAIHLAHLLRLGLIQDGYIYPREDRGLRDLSRKRCQLVRQRTANLLSIENQLMRRAGSRPSGAAISKWTPTDLEAQSLPDDEKLAIESNLAIFDALDKQIDILEKTLRQRMKKDGNRKLLLTMPGVGEILAGVIALETGPIERFRNVGNYSSYCRMVSSERTSNGKRKGSGNAKSGNRFLSWAFCEAAHFAIRYNPGIQGFYQRKKAKTNGIVALKTVAHKLARAAYYILRNNTPFEEGRCFN
jgi:transposase